MLVEVGGFSVEVVELAAQLAKFANKPRVVLQDMANSVCIGPARGIEA